MLVLKWNSKELVMIADAAQIKEKNSTRQRN
jgi:hypothetical protein